MINGGDVRCVWFGASKKPSPASCSANYDNTLSNIRSLFAANLKKLTIQVEAIKVSYLQLKL